MISVLLKRAQTLTSLVANRAFRLYERAEKRVNLRESTTVVVALAPIVLLGCQATTPEPSQTPNIILISLDTVRRDSLDIYRQVESDRTPNLNRLARAAFIFDGAFAPVPFTLPSHMTMFTGLHPDVHGVESEDLKLADSIPTLPEVFSQAGYRTIGITSNLLMSPGFGFERGFDHYERIEFDLVPSQRVRERTFQIIDEQTTSKKRPLFLFLHFNDAHSDYYRVGNSSLPYYVPEELLTASDLAPDDSLDCDTAGRCATDFLIAANQARGPVSQKHLDRLRRLYELGIQHLDSELGLLFSGLKKRGLWDSSIVVITSDHGEEFREHGEFLHRQPYIENLAIPLMIKTAPESKGSVRLAATIDLGDLAPTILDLAGLEPPETMLGRSLVSLLEGRRRDETPVIGKEKLSTQHYVLRDRTFSLIHDFSTGRSQLFDRSADRHELDDVVEERPDLAASLLAELEDQIRRNRASRARILGDEVPRARPFSAEDQERLRSLGYLQ